MNKRRDSGTSTREHILDVALDLFSGRDYNGTSIEEITTRANITKGALYHHFRDKKELFIEVCQVSLNAYRVEVFDRSQSRPLSSSGIEALIRNSHDFNVRFPLQSRLYMRMVLEDWSDDERLGPIIKQSYDDYRESVGRLIMDDMAKERIRRMDAGVVTTLIIAILDGLAIHNTMGAGRPLPERELDIMIESIIDGLQPWGDSV